MKKLRPTFLKIIIPVIAATGVAAWFFMWANSPNHGTVSTVSPKNVPAVYQDKLLKGTNFQFQYAGNYLIKQEAAINGDTERYTLSAGTRYDKRILAYVTKLPDGQIESYGAYIYRQSSPNIYAMRKLQAGGNVYNIWVRNDGTEQTTMIPQGDKAAILTIVTANPKDDLATEMDALLKSFRWK